MAGYNFVLDTLDAIGVDVVGLSVDSREDCAALTDRLGLEFPLVGELAYPDALDAVGAYRFEQSASAFQATAFVLDPERHVEAAVYSATNVGRLTPEEVMRAFG